MDSSSNYPSNNLPALTTDKNISVGTIPLTGPKNNPMQNPVLSKVDRNSVFNTWDVDDNVVINQVMDTHLPKGTGIHVKTLLQIVEDVLQRATIHAEPSSSGAHTDHVDKVEDESYQTNASLIDMLHKLSHTIDKLACEMVFKCLTGEHGNTTTLALFRTVSNFDWEAKLVLTLAAFALNYGEFRLLAKIYSSNYDAGSMAILRQVAIMIMEHSAPLKPLLDALNKLIHSILELTRCIVEFKELPSEYMSYILRDEPAVASAINTIPTAVYWNIRGIIACAAQITTLTSTGNEYEVSSTELQSSELSTLTLKINLKHEYLRQRLEQCRRIIGDAIELEFRRSFDRLFETTHVDNMKMLKILICPRDDIMPLYDGTTKKTVSLEVLRRRNVLLLISALDMSRDELSILEQIYSESRIQGTRMDALYEVVWMPIVDPSIQYTDAMDRQFEDMKNNMPWYSVYHPSIIDRAVIRSIGDRWHFRNKPILVVLDPQGKELSPNAIHMMWIWGSNAFPFTSSREEALWRDETWRLEFLVRGMDPTILCWIRDEKYIFLYGGDDIEWIRKFTTTARAMATAARIPLEMNYVGKSKKKENVRRAIATINVEKLSYCWQDTTLMWFFWTRLESMLYSKIQLKKADDQDHMMQQIRELLSYDKGESWALFCRGTQILASGHGSTMLQTPADYDLWKEHIPTKGFDQSFVEYHDTLHVAANGCCRLEFPTAAGRVPDVIRCPECHRLMEKSITFLCCHDQTGLLEPY